ncbi:MAG TPA: hypothetical protein VHQ46_04530 [Desulfobacteria bacterium]|nr:hypothetical protein [Desulfobacteria bacterium]
MDRVPGRQLWQKEGIASVLFLAATIILALMLPAAVGTSPQAPAATHTIAPWIFGPIQVLLLYLPPWLGAVLLPLAAIIFLLGYPWISKAIGSAAARGLFFSLLVVSALLLLWFMVKEYWWR